ncbi:Golgin subfamily A member 7/ERF4 family-domain-containing protein [Whalleya microplaca]|nr:Golgin subfamily A member 7/ERF4 family-domain-containing protein [Whalleya microplaca]
MSLSLSRQWLLSRLKGLKERTGQVQRLNLASARFGFVAVAVAVAVALAVAVAVAVASTLAKLIDLGLHLGALNCLGALGSLISRLSPLNYSTIISYYSGLGHRNLRLEPTRFPKQDPGRPCGRFAVVFPTASHAGHTTTNLPSTTLDAQTNPIPDPPVDSSSRHHNNQPITTPERAVIASQHPQSPQSPRTPGARRNWQATRNPSPVDYFLQSPFRNRAAASDLHYRLPRRFGPGRLWNPTNSTPRGPPSQTSSRPSRTPRPARDRAPSSPPPPPVPINHPSIEVSSDPNDPIGTGAGDFPLLTLSEQRQNRHSATARASLQIEGRASADKRISLPSSLRHSKSSQDRNSRQLEAGPSEPAAKSERPTKVSALRKRGQSVTKRARAISFGLVRFDPSEVSPKVSPKKLDKGKGKAVMSSTENDDPSRGFSKDLERGGDVLGRHRGSNLSLPDGISALSSNSSIMGDPDQPDLGEEWGPQHPCFPHLNPHVPVNSPEYTTTRIIRVRRDWLVEGDLAPTFSNLYPEILDPAGVSEQEFRRVIEKLNGELVPIFTPYNWRNILDGILGLLTGWIWDDLGLTSAKTRLRSLEDWIEKWNAEMEKTIGSEEGTIAPRIVPLRRTGYMNLDIQIPDPEIAPANSEPSGSRAGPQMPSEPRPAILPESPVES